MKPWYIDLPELAFDATHLIQVVENRQPDEWKPYLSNKGEDMGFESFRYSGLYQDYPYAQALRGRLNFDTGPLRSGFVRFKPWYNIPIHLDEGPDANSPVRECAIIFPLTPTAGAAPIRWHNPDGSVAMEHHYAAAYPTLINVQIPHSVSNNQYTRICWQISLYGETFEQAAEKYDNGTFYKDN